MKILKLSVIFVFVGIFALAVAFKNNVQSQDVTTYPANVTKGQTNGSAKQNAPRKISS